MRIIYNILSRIPSVKSGDKEPDHEIWSLLGEYRSPAIFIILLLVLVANLLICIKPCKYPQTMFVTC